MRICLLLVVLIQYMPLGFCAFECSVLGTECHDCELMSGARGVECKAEGQSNGSQDCLCRQKVDPQHNPQTVKPSWERVHLSIAYDVASLTPSDGVTPGIIHPDPPPDSRRPQQLPLLI